MSHEWDGIAFSESRYANCSDCYVPVDVTYSTLSCGSNSVLVRDTLSFYSVCKVLSCPSSALLDDATVEGLDYLTLGEACVVACADGYTAAGDIEITMTCVLDLELTGHMSLGKWALCDLSTARASFHRESRLSEDSLREVLCRQLLTRDFRDRGFHCVGGRSVFHLRSTDGLHWRSLAQRLFVWV